MKRPTSSGRRKSHPIRAVKSPNKGSISKQTHPSSPSTPKSTSPRKSLSKTTTKNATMDVSRRTRRFKSGTKALREIRALQRSTNLLIPKASFCRLVKEIINQFSYHDMRIQSSALQALQEAAEMYMVQIFEDSLLCTLHGKRVTLQINDLHLVRRLRGPDEVCNR